MITQTLAAEFSCAHLYEQKNWSADRNASEFGRCFTPHGHGHNYRLEVEYGSSALSEEQVELMEKAIRSEADRLDHVHLNFVIPEFKEKIPTTENIALFIWEKLQARKLPAVLHRLRLYEMDDLWVEVLP